MNKQLIIDNVLKEAQLKQGDWSKLTNDNVQEIKRIIAKLKIDADVELVEPTAIEIYFNITDINAPNSFKGDPTKIIKAIKKAGYKDMASGPLHAGQHGNRNVFITIMKWIDSLEKNRKWI